MKTTIKTFKRYLKEERNKWYSLDLTSDMTKDDVIVRMNELLPYTFKLLKQGDVVIKLEPVPEMEEE
jgi:hypothetical protein